MLKKIESLRKKPKHIRNQYAFWIAFGCTVIITVAWASALPSRFSQNTTSNDRDSEELSDFMNTLGDMQNDVSDTFKNLQEQTEKLQVPAEATSTTERPDFILQASTTEKAVEIILPVGATTIVPATLGE